MDKAIKKAFDLYIDETMEQLILSKSTDIEQANKIKIRPVLIKNELCYQTTSYCKTKVFHQNFTKEEMMLKLDTWLGILFLQAELKGKKANVTVLISKKGKVTVKCKKVLNSCVSLEGKLEKGKKEQENIEALAHNRKKHYILEEGIPIPFLVDLGVMTAEGKIIQKKYDKYRQINRFLEFIEDILEELPKDREIKILDFGCGKSYLTFAMYYYLKELKGYFVKIIGLDLKQDVIEHCNQLSVRYGYEGLTFLKGDIASYQEENKVDMVVTLHACDTATDYALEKAVRWGAKVILSVPCCQHELNRQLKNEVLQPILKYGLIKERMAALITDAVRAELLEQQGYKVQILEFIDMEHTPKNILIRAVKSDLLPNKKLTNQKKEQLNSCMELLQIHPTLKDLFS